MTGYVLKMFPRFSETFVLAEILELESCGHPLAVLSLRKPDDGRFHAECARVAAAVTYLPEHARCRPGAFLRAHARALASRPGRYAAILRSALRHRGEAKAAFLRAPLVAEWASAVRCTRLHAHFASLPAVTTMLASRLAGTPFTFTAHAKDIFLDGRSPRLLRELIERAARVVTVSDFNVDFLRRLAGDGIPEDRIVRVYNGVDLETFRPGVAPEPAAGTPRILAVGRLVEKKGFADLVHACALLRDRGVAFACEIVGQGPLRYELEELVAARGLERQVRLVGPLPREVVAERLRGAALLAVPCVVGRDGNRDGLPTVILEAMASGLSVVATPVTGTPEAVEDGVTGRLVPEAEPRAFAAGLAELLGDPALRARMGRAARARAERLFDRRANVAVLDGLLEVDRAAPAEARATVERSGPVLARRS